MVGTAPLNRVVRFGPFELSVATGELRKSGITLKLRPQARKVLVLLATRSGEMVTREQLKEQIWGTGLFVDFEHGLNLCIQQIRAALDDDADRPRYIETLPRHGYRFIARVEEFVSDPGARPQTATPSSISVPGFRTTDVDQIRGPQKGARWRSRPWAMAGVGLCGLAVAIALFAFGGLRGRLAGRAANLRIESIAVLPLENLSRDADQEYFSEGITDALITDLAQIGSLKVISRTSSMRYKQTKKSLPEIARELNVDGVVEGTVQRSGDRVRITAQLIHGPSDRHLWASSYERDLHDILALQDSVAQSIARSVHLVSNLQASARSSNPRTVDPEAYEAFLKGRFFLNQRTPDGMKNAVAQFRRAVARDPGYALAYAGLSDSYSLLHYYYFKSRMETITDEKAAALKAVELDESSAETHTSLAQTFVDEWNWPEAEKEFQRAIELNSNYSLAHLWYSWFLQYQGRHTEAGSEAQRALDLDPLGGVSNANLGYIYAELRQYDQAINQLQKSLELNPDYADPHLELANVFFLNHQYPLGYTELARAAELSSQKSFASCVQAAIHASPHTHFQRSMEALAECRVRASKSELLSSYDTAVEYAFSENQEKAFEWLEKAYHFHDDWLSYLRVDPAFEELHHDPRFAGLLRRMNLPADSTGASGSPQLIH